MPTGFWWGNLKAGIYLEDMYMYMDVKKIVVSCLHLCRLVQKKKDSKLYIYQSVNMRVEISM